MENHPCRTGGFSARIRIGVSVANRLPRDLLQTHALFAICGVIGSFGVGAVSSNRCFAGGPTPRFERDVQPLLIAHCYECHGTRNPEAGVDLRSVALMTESRKNTSPVVIPGSPQKSRLFRAVKDGAMPPDGSLSDEALETIRAWIAADCPADAPRAVYGATFFQNWGMLFCILAVLNMIAVGILWRGILNAGTSVVVLAGVPVLALKVSEVLWYPPDAWSVAAVAAMAVGLIVGGILIAGANRGNPCAGAGWALLAPIGLIPLARSGNSNDVSHRDDGKSPAVDAET